MKAYFKLIFFLAVAQLLQFVCLSSASAELIEPTRNLKGGDETVGRLTVLSEPPGLEVTLDGSDLGKTPAFLVEVKPGIHKLRVKDIETEIYLRAGKTLKISLYKGEFIEIPPAAEARPKQPDLEQQRKASAPPLIQPSAEEQRAKDEKRQTQERWMRFLDGTDPNF